MDFTNILQYEIKWQQEIAIMLIGYARVLTQEQGRGGVAKLSARKRNALL